MKHLTKIRQKNRSAFTQSINCKDKIDIYPYEELEKVLGKLYFASQTIFLKEHSETLERCFLSVWLCLNNIEKDKGE